MAVYFIRAGAGPVKIGVADEPRRRLIDLQIGNHEPLTLLREIAGADAGHERWLHLRYDHLRVRGEWFRFCDSMIEIVPQRLDLPDPINVSRNLGLAKAIAVLGVAELARRVGVSSQAVSQWEQVPAERALAVERATNGTVGRQELRPDLYPLEESAA